MKKIILSAVALVGALTLNAQDDAPKLSVSGTVDAYYQTYLTAPDDATVSFGTSFADEAGFALGMANLVLSYDGEKTGVVADLVYGPRGDSAAGGYNLNQLYAYWNVSETTTLTAGRFNTYLGYEVISPAGNFNYSTSYLFSNGPFSHVGLKADFALGEDFSLMLAVMNPTDTNNNTTGDYGLGAQLGYAGQYLNLYYDNDSVLGFEIDYTGGFDITDDFFLGINAAYQIKPTNEVEEVLDDDGELIDEAYEYEGGFAGVALYPQYSVSDSFALGLRGEYFVKHGDTDEPSVFATTLTGSYTVENLTIKPEIRLDAWSDNEPYVDADSVASESLGAFTIAAIYSF